MGAERGGKNPKAAFATPSFFDTLTTTPSTEAARITEGLKNYYIKLLNAAAGYEVAREPLRHYPQGPILILNGTWGDYCLATRTSRIKSGWSIEPLVVGNQEHLERILAQSRHKKVAGVIVSLMKDLNFETRIYMKRVSDNLEKVMVPDYRFFVTFVDCGKNPVPMYITKSERARLKSVNPNHGSEFEPEAVWYDSAIGCRVLVCASSRPHLAEKKSAVPEAEWEKRGKTIVRSPQPGPWFDGGTRPSTEEFPASFDVELDIECKNCGQRNLNASYREGAGYVEVGCGSCAHPQQYLMDEFEKRFAGYIIADESCSIITT